MTDFELTLVQMNFVANTPLRVLTLFVATVMAVIIVLNSN